MRTWMHGLVAVVLGATVAVAGSIGETRAARQGAFEMEILVDGRPLAELVARGSRYVEAFEGREYAVRLTNRTGRRVAVALAVDGLNSIDARHTTMAKARKWIVGPRRSIVIEGWQTGNDTARRFFFTTEARSYGAWLGRTEDLGTIEAAFFPERPRRPPPRPVPYVEESGAGAGAGDRRSSKAAPPARADAEASEVLDEGLAATGIGREIDHRVRKIDFDSVATPAAVLAVRYEYRDALVRLGVLPPGDDALARRERAGGFEDSDFAPDPYR